MMNRKRAFLTLVFFTGMAIVLADFLILFLFGRSPFVLSVRFGLPILAFAIVYCGILGRVGQCFDPAFFRNTAESEYVKRLKSIGAVPIKLIGLNVVLHAVFLGCIFVHNGYLGIEPGIKTPLFLAMLSLGILAGTFLYVMADGLVSHTLVAQNITQYPRDLRENRQALKTFIVPLAIALVTLIFTNSITVLGYDKQGNTSFAIIISMIIFFCCIVGLAFILRKNTAVIYATIIEQMENLSAARKDLTKRICICSVDELATTAGMVNSFCEQLNGGIRNIKDGQRELAGLGNQLEKDAAVMADSIAQISGATEQAQVMTQDSVSHSSQAIQRIADQVMNLEESIVAQTSSMGQASSSVEEMVGSISSINSVTERMTVQFRAMGQAVTEGTRIQKESSARIQEIVEQSQALQEANRIIATIAAQTNLLSMNAAIEAAHAGETGKGFSVVASEIRKLAENSSQESHKIGNELKQIVRTIDNIVQDAKTSENALAEVSRRIDETESLVIEVNNAIREQKIGAGQVMDALRIMNDLNARVNDGSRQMGQGNQVMLLEVDALQTSGGQISVRMEEISGSLKNINSSAREVSHLAAVSQSSIHKISAIVDEFEV